MPCDDLISGTVKEHRGENRVLLMGRQEIVEMILSGADVRMALMDRRTELIRCASVVKDGCFDAQIAKLDDAIFKIWDAKQIELNIVN